MLNLLIAILSQARQGGFDCACFGRSRD